jgi:hypothetical protein
MTEDLNKLVDVDYFNYRTSQDFEINFDQKLLIYKLEKVKDEYLLANNEKQNNVGNSFFPFLGIDLAELSPHIKTFYTLIVLNILAGITLYLVNKYQNKKGKKKNKNNNYKVNNQQ